MATLAAEFPNDNPALHGGVIWVCLDVTSAPVAERTAAPVAAPEPAVVEPEVAEPDVAEPEVPPARPSGIFAIADAPFAIEHEMEETDEEIVVEELLPLEDDASVEVIAAPQDPFDVFVAALVDVAIAQGSPATVADVIHVALEDPIGRAWAGILRGTSDDWSAVGAAMLDDWATELLARLLGAPQQAPLLKRELRARGVAAFGLIEAA